MALDMMRVAIPDLHWNVEEMIAEGDKVMVGYTMTGLEATRIKHNLVLNKLTSQLI